MIYLLKKHNFIKLESMELGREITVQNNIIINEAPELLSYFKIPHSDSVHVSQGLSLEAFLSSLYFSIIYCLLQILLFSYLRPRYPQFYEPFGDRLANAKIQTTVLQREALCNENIFEHCNPMKCLNIRGFKKYGLDSYLFLRFLYMSLYLFIGIACIAIPILLPINFLCGRDTKNGYNANLLSTALGDIDSEGLDLISISNISSKHTDKYIFHFLVTIFVIFWFHHVLIHEINYCIRLKHKKIIELSHSKEGQEKLSVIYIENIDTEKYKTCDDFRKLFESFLPGCINSIYPIHDFETLDLSVKHYKECLFKLEEYELELIKAKNELTHTNNSEFMYLPVKIFDNLKLSIPGISPRVKTYDYLVSQLHNLAREIKHIQFKILSNDSTIKNGKAFVRFKKISSAYIIKQILLSKKTETMNHKIIEINPDDINWTNIVKKNDNFSLFLRKTILFLVSFVVIMCWVIPVAFVGSISQLPYLTALIPTISWLNKLPNIFKAFIAGILPTVVLTFLTSFALKFFQRLTNQKRKLTGSLSELSLQNWIFIFLFFQLFIVITISSGFIVVLEKLLYNPISIPTIVAIDFPKSSNFFFSFFVLRGLTLFGNSLLQFYNFLINIMIYPLLDITPRQKFQRRCKKIRDVKNNWGQVYPTFSVYASIGIVYSVISPLILIFCCINFVLDLFAYKYLMKYTMKKENDSETFGKLYSIGLRQIYAGIYSLEIFVMGLFFLVRDNNGRKTCISLGIMMLFVTIMTVFVHITINRKYEKNIEMIPLEMFKTLDDGIVKGCEYETKDYENIIRMKYLHPSFSFQSKKMVIWIPRDEMGFCNLEKIKLEKAGFKVFLDGCVMDDRGELELIKALPEY